LPVLQGFLPAVALDAAEFAIDPIGPPAEVVDLAADLLLPGPAGVRRQREVGVRLLREARGFTGTTLPSRMVRHGATSGPAWQVASLPTEGEVSRAVFRVEVNLYSSEKTAFRRGG